MADQIRRGCLRLSRTGSSSARPIGEHWIDRFKTRHTGLSSVWTRQIERARYPAVGVGAVQMWFDAVAELCLAH